MNLLILMTIASLSLLVTHSLGYLSLRAWSRFDWIECWALSGAAGVACLGGLAFIIFLAQAFNIWIYLACALGLGSITLYLAHRRERKIFIWPMEARLNSLNYLFGFLTIWLIMLLTQLGLPIYTGGNWYGDWWMHFDIAQVYLGIGSIQVVYFDQYNLISRTPLFNWVASFYLGLFQNLMNHSHFAIYQVTALVPSLAFVSVLMLWVKRFTRVDMPWTITFFLTFNPFLARNILYPWPKLLTSAYILVALYIYITIRNKPLETPNGRCIAWGLWIGFALLSHPLAIFFIVGMGVDLIITQTQGFHQKINVWQASQKFLLAGFGGLLVLSPWLLWSIYHFGFTGFTATPFVAGRDVSFTFWVVEKIWNIIATLLPHALLKAMLQALIAWISGQTYQVSVNPVWYYYYQVLPGAITTILSGLILFSLFKPLRSGGAFLIIILCGFFGNILLYPWFSLHGLAPESMVPLILLGIIWAYIAWQQTPIWFKWGALCLLVIEFFLSRGLHLLWLIFNLMPAEDNNLALKTEQQLTFARDMINAHGTILVLSLAIAYGVLIYLTVWETIQCHLYAHD